MYTVKLLQKKMKKIIFMALVATTFFACSNNEENEKIEGTKLKSLEFTLDVATPKTRMSDGTVTTSAIAAVRQNVASVTIEYFNSADKPLGTYNFSADEVATVRSDNQNETEIANRKAVRINDIPGATTKVNVYLNVKQATNINKLQDSYKDMEYRGDAPTGITLAEAGGGDTGNDLYRVEVEVKPVMSRFEFTGDASNIVINSSANGKKPADNLSATETQAKAAVNTSTFNNAVEAAKNAWRAKNPGQADPATWTLGYALTYTFDNAYTIKSIQGYYMNNIRTEKGSNALVLNVNDAAGNWDTAGLNSYAANGSLEKMFDTTVEGGKNIAYNLFTQNVAEGSNLAAIKAGMPHFILKLETSVDTRWLTIRALKETKVGGTLVSSFEAGKVYVLNATDIEINQYSVNLTVTANNEVGPTIPEPVDPTDPNPEPVGKDLDVLVKIKDWTVVNVKPEW